MKYAIFENPYCYEFYEYFDTLDELKSYGFKNIYGLPIDLGEDVVFPVVINSLGTAKHFSESMVEKGFDGSIKKFVRLVESLESIPLPLNSIYPINTSNFCNGWIDQNGNTYSVGSHMHIFSSNIICKCLNIDCSGLGSSATLEKLGWLHVRKEAGKVTVTSTYGNISSEQIQKLNSLNLINNLKVLSWESK